MRLRRFWQSLFLGASFLLAYTYFLFPILLAWRARRHKKVPEDRPKDGYFPTVTMIIPALNEEAVIIDKLDNATALNYPQDCLQILVAANGSEDRTEALVDAYLADNVELISLPERGKNEAINRAAASASGDILVFTDADSLLETDALRELVAPFRLTTIGAAGGDYRLAGDVSHSDGERRYWDMDRWLKTKQSQAGNMTSAAGPLLALRRSLFQCVPSGVTDDFFLSTLAPLNHYRLLFVPQAVAHGPAPKPQGEFGRRVRVVTRGFNSVWQQRRLLNPLEHGFYAIQLFTHKILRRLMVLPLSLLWLSTICLTRGSLAFRFLALGQTAFYLAGALGILLKGKPAGRHPVLSLPAYFLATNIAAGIAAINFVRRKRYDTWVVNR